MLSDRYKCIFVRISKVASTSVLNAFLAHQKEGDTGNFDLMHHDIGFYKESYPEVFDTYFKFAFVRNPWDRIYSQYRYLKHTKKFSGAAGTFREYILACETALQSGEVLFGRNRAIFVRHMTNQLDWLTIDDKIAVDYIGRYETLAEDFKTAMEHIDPSIVLPHDNRSVRESGSYRDVYDEVTRNLVEKWHAKDLEYFDYQY